MQLFLGYTPTTLLDVVSLKFALVKRACTFYITANEGQDSSEVERCVEGAGGGGSIPSLGTNLNSCDSQRRKSGERSICQCLGARSTIGAGRIARVIFESYDLANKHARVNYEQCGSFSRGVAALLALT